MRRLFAGVVTAAFAAAANGQQPPLTQPSSIPLDLALALTGSGGLGSGAEAQILVGSIPEWATQRVPIPSGWRVIGSAFLNTTVIGVVQIPTRGDSLIQDFEAHLLRQSWKTPPPPPSYGGGFRPAPAGSGSGRAARRIMLCRDNQSLSSWIAREEGLATTIAFRLTTASVGAQCNPPPPDPRVLQWAADRGMPTLNDPAPRDMGQASCYQSSDNDGSNSTETRYRTSMTGEQVLDHYARQLADSGWLASRGILTRSWTLPDSARGLRYVTLSVTRSPRDSSCVRVRMETSRERRAP
jgi:hypothetical protein